MRWCLCVFKDGAYVYLRKMVAQGTLPDKATAPKDREKYASYGVILAKNLHFY